MTEWTEFKLSLVTVELDASSFEFSQDDDIATQVDHLLGERGGQRQEAGESARSLRWSLSQSPSQPLCRSRSVAGREAGARLWRGSGDG